MKGNFFYEQFLSSFYSEIHQIPILSCSLLWPVLKEQIIGHEGPDAAHIGYYYYDVCYTDVPQYCIYRALREPAATVESSQAFDLLPSDFYFLNTSNFIFAVLGRCGTAAGNFSFQ